MTDDLVITARFPLGVFHGADGDGEGQAFPAPSRLAAALLSVAGEGAGLTAVRELFAADPPVIDHPDVLPGRPVMWWRPRTGRWRDEWDVDKKSLGSRIPGSPVPYTFYGDAVVWYRWTGLGHLAEPLADVARRVPYLGRATSPVLLDAASTSRGAAAVEDGRVRLTPSARGAFAVTVPTTSYLEDLDAFHAARMELGVSGHDVSVEVVRAEARYERGVTVAVGPPRGDDAIAAERWASERFTALVPSSSVPTDSVDLVLAWVQRSTDAAAVVPVCDTQGQLRTVLVDDGTVGSTTSGPPEGAAEKLVAPTFRGVVELRGAHLVAEAGSSSRAWVARRLCGTSPLWVSAVGIRLDDLAAGRELLESLALGTGREVVGTSASSAPRSIRLPDLAGTGRHYLTVQLDTSTTGPVRAETASGSALWFLPVHPSTGALL